MEGMLKDIDHLKLILAFIILLAYLIPFFLDIGTYIMHVFIVVLTFAIFAQAWNILAGFAGQISLGHQAFFGLGAYVSALLVYYLNLNPWSTLIIAGIFTSIFSIFFGAISFRLRGPYFLLTTFSLAEIIRLIILNIPEVTRGALGIIIPVPQPVNIGGFLVNFRSKLPYYYIALTILFLTFFWAKKIDESDYGFKLKMLREDEDAAASLGVNTFRVKLFALMISTFISGLIGAFYAQYILYIDPSSDPGGVLSPRTGFDAILICTLGGRGTILGPLIGAFIRYGLGEWIRITFGMVAGLETIVFGVFLVIIIVFMPQGIWFHFEKLINLYKTRKGKTKRL